MSTVTIPLNPGSGRSGAVASPALLGSAQTMKSNATAKPWYKPGDTDRAHNKAMADPLLRKEGR